MTTLVTQLQTLQGQELSTKVTTAGAHLSKGLAKRILLTQASTTPTLSTLVSNYSTNASSFQTSVAALALVRQNKKATLLQLRAQYGV